MADKKKPMPKQEDYPTTKEWMVAVRKWRSAQSGSESKKPSPRPKKKPKGKAKDQAEGIQKPKEGDTKLGPAGNRYVFKGGVWVRQ
jgi:hypothetical protein